MKRKGKGLLGIGVLTAIAASLCCITPVLALVAGISGLTSSFSWIEPARPYLITITILVLVFAWYRKLKSSKEEVDCDCEEDEKHTFLQSKKFLGIVTVFALLMLTFPLYSSIFFPDSQTKAILTKDGDFVEATLTIEGMTCISCEHHVNHALTKNEGVIESSASYEEGFASVKFDTSKISIEELANAIEKETGYKVLQQKILYKDGK